MREITLFTEGSRGEFVAVVEILPFPDLGLPRVVLWGSRCFVLTTACDAQDRPIFGETLAAISFTPSPGLALKEPEIRSASPVDRDAVTTLHGTPIGEHTEIQPSGMQKDYVVLTAEERAKGFVRPVRQTYVHTKCGTSTTMGLALAETYARDPKFYSGTFCAHCKAHFPVDVAGGFHWVGTDEKVGT